MYYNIYNAKAKYGYEYLGTVKTDDTIDVPHRIQAEKRVKDVLGLNKDDIDLLISIELWYKEKPI